MRRSETRLAVIRNAATRAAKSLALKQLSDPSELTAHQLSQVAVSTYRLLDPRQRPDRQSRIHIGRIRPGAMYQAGATQFADHRAMVKQWKARLAEPTVVPPVESEKSVESQQSIRIDTAKPPSLSADQIHQQGDARGRRQWRLRKGVQHPAVMITMMLLLLSASGGLLMWGRSIRSSRLHPPADVSAEMSQSESAGDSSVSADSDSLVGEQP
ncbi:hypothetical protein CGZ80_22745 [Rhodopirellula sp. MGV]|nr:hypothetical protein CGZ80_22745 [Rhodopirellula sp. MGV]PNY34669.1 hypothetical protein C2E31_22090 [Rhodopirellula baltica]